MHKMHKLMFLVVVLLAPLAAQASSSTGSDGFSPEKGLDLGRSFQAQHQAFLQALADGETYSEIPARDRQTVKSSLDRISTLLADAQSVDQLSETNRVEVFNEQERVNTLLTRAREDSRMVCTREKKVGSHRATNNCMTVGQRRRAREQSQDALLNNSGYKAPQSN